MNPKTAGYLTDVAYPAVYHRELSPAWLGYVTALHGVTAPDHTRPFRYLELGCGTGLSGVLHAAAFPWAEFHLCDFNTLCLEAARVRAERLAAGNVTLHGSTFSELRHADLPAFDYIVLHGVYTWVEATQREAILDIVRRRLRPGGVLYVSYNCVPGWSAEVPLVRLSNELAGTLDGDSAGRARAVARVLELMAGSGFRFFTDSHAAGMAVTAYLRANADYLAHELLNAAWAPACSVDVHRQLAAAGARFLGSATLADNHPALIVDEAASGLVAALPPELRQLAMDFAVNRRFRRDVFTATASGSGSDAGPAAVAAATTLIGTLNEASTFEQAARVPLGRIQFDASFVRALGRLVAGRPWPLGELVARLAGQRHDHRAVARNVHYAIAAGMLRPFARAGSPACSAAPTRFVDGAVEECFREAADSDNAVWIPSTVAGGGIEVTGAAARQVLRGLEPGARASRGDVLVRFRRLGLLE